MPVLQPGSVIPLHNTCSRLRALTRANASLWRSFCVAQAYAADGNPEDRPEPPVTPATPQWHRSNADLDAIIDAWPHQGVDWYSEYRFRHAPLAVRWLSPPEVEVKGLTAVACHSHSHSHSHLLISPLDDGAISVWSLPSPSPSPSPSASAGLLLARSRPGLLSTPPPPASRRSRIVELGDNVVASAALDRIYVAADSTLLELSMTTLQTVNVTKFPFSISTLSSQLAPPHPLTVGTTLTLHLHDPRVAAAGACGSPSSLPSLPFPENYGWHAPLFQPSPLAILHHPNDRLYVAGRFPSILSYDRAMWPRLQSTIHSGSSLCALAADGPDGLLAGGTYNGRGLLESYHHLLSSPSSPSLSAPASRPSGARRVYQKNRQSAAWGKILSVAQQGTRVVAGDSEGTVSWFERDCRYVVRRESLSDPAARIRSHRATALWDGLADDGSGPLRKLLVLDGAAGDQGMAVWLGDRVGMLAPAGPDAVDDSYDSGESSHEEMLESQMAERMRRMLRGQADEVALLGPLAGFA